MITIDTASVSESLILDVHNSTFLTVENPTSEASIVNNIFSNNALVWNGTTEIPPFGNCSFGLFPSADGNFEVTTVKGNLYMGSVNSELEYDASRAWNVAWYVGDSVPFNTSDLTSDTQIGGSYWYRLSMDWVFGTGYPVVGTYSFADNKMMGFVAVANLIKLTDNNSIATINYRIDNSSKIAVSIDNVMQDPLGLGQAWDNHTDAWYNSTDFAWFTLKGSLYSVHTVVIYYFGYGDNSQELTLNVVNATFAPQSLQNQ